MSLTPIRIISDAIIDSLQEDRQIHAVLVDPILWLGFLLQLDLPEKSDDLKKITILDGQSIVKKHMERVRKFTFYDEDCPFDFKLNTSIKGVRVLFYQKRSEEM